MATHDVSSRYQGESVRVSLRQCSGAHRRKGIFDGGRTWELRRGFNPHAGRKSGQKDLVLPAKASLRHRSWTMDFRWTSFDSLEAGLAVRWVGHGGNFHA